MTFKKAPRAKEKAKEQLPLVAEGGAGYRAKKKSRSK